MTAKRKGAHRARQTSILGSVLSTVIRGLVAAAVLDYATWDQLVRGGR